MWFVVLAIVCLPLIGGLLYGFCWGVGAILRSFNESGEYASTLRLLGINLCEPLVNTIVVGLLALRTNGHPLALCLCTVPMAILLVPARGLRFSDPFYRDQSRRILHRGLWRWGLNLLAFAGAFGGTLVIATGVLGLIIGTIMLWFHVTEGRDQLNQALAAPLAAPPASLPTHRQVASAAAIASRPASPVPAPLFVPPPVPATAIHCAICQAPASSDAAACPACGLVFHSRVPAALRSLTRYEVLRPLGDGGMSSVYLARRRADPKLCVLKTLASVDQQAAAWRLEASRCLQREAELLSQLDHPHVARLLDRSSEGPNEFLVLEYVAGPTLEQELTRASARNGMMGGTALSPGEVLAYGRSVAETLCYLAGLPQPIIHCDIKPANLILPQGGRAPVLVDFGGAVRASSAGEVAVQLDRYGTPGYAAPEQYAGAASPRSDVYGLAATLYHLLTDDDPAVHPLAFPSLSMLPADIAAALTPALAREPAMRPDPWHFSRIVRELAAHYAAPPVAAA